MPVDIASSHAPQGSAEMKSSPEALRAALDGLWRSAQESSDGILSGAITAGQRALEEWQQAVASLRHHEEVRSLAASTELRARDRLNSVLELLTKLSGHSEMIGPSADRSQRSQSASTSRPRPGLAVRMLGNFELDFDGQPVRDWHGRRAVSIMQFLLSNRRHGVCRETLIDAIWSEIPADRGRRRLHQGIYDLRGTLRAADPGRTHIICVNGSYRLDPTIKIWVDVEEFDRLVSAAADSQANNRLDEAFEFCRAAKRLYRADFLSDATGLDWATVERHRLRTRYIVLCNQLARLHAARGEPRCAIAVLERVLAKDPWNEDSARIMMQCYVEMGQLSLAMRVFKSCEGALERELGVRPAAETLKLYRRILAEPGSAVTSAAHRPQSRPPRAAVPAAAAPGH